MWSSTPAAYANAVDRTPRSSSAFARLRLETSRSSHSRASSLPAMAPMFTNSPRAGSGTKRMRENWNDIATPMLGHHPSQACSDRPTPMVHELGHHGEVVVGNRPVAGGAERLAEAEQDQGAREHGREDAQEQERGLAGLAAPRRLQPRAR